jgi:hypothetical protein
MRGVLFGLAAMGAGGAALTHGYLGGSDYERDIAKSPTAVYSAFSQVADAGEVNTQGDKPGDTITSRVRKVEGRQLVFEALMNGKSIIRMEFDFASKNGGSATHMTADLDLDKSAFAQLDPALGETMGRIPDAIINLAFAHWMEHNVKEIEAGRPLLPFDVASAPFESQLADSNPRAAVQERQWEAERAQRAAAAPSATAEPMVDPNRSAEQYLHHRGGED